MLSRDVDLASGTLSAAQVVAKLKALGFQDDDRSPPGRGVGSGGPTGDDDFDEESESSYRGGKRPLKAQASAGSGASGGLSRLLALPLSSLTRERVVVRARKEFRVVDMAFGVSSELS